MMSINRLPFCRRTLRRLTLACVTKKGKSHLITKVDGISLALDLNQHLDKEYFIGKYDREELSFLMKAFENCEKGTAFVDIGANQGLYSLMIAKSVPDCQVIAFEPDPYSVEKFRENIVLNNAENIVLVPKGLSDKREKKLLMLNTATNRAGSSMVLSQTKYTKKQEEDTIEVECVPITDALSAAGVTKIGALKIDVEGYEYPILYQFLKEAPLCCYPKAVILEAWGHAIPLVGGSPIELMIAHGYKLVNHVEYNYFFLR